MHGNVWVQCRQALERRHSFKRPSLALQGQAEQQQPIGIVGFPDQRRPAACFGVDKVTGLQGGDCTGSFRPAIHGDPGVKKKAAPRDV
jgi:hypothetical protein